MVDGPFRSLSAREVDAGHCLFCGAIRGAEDSACWRCKVEQLRAPCAACHAPKLVDLDLCSCGAMTHSETRAAGPIACLRCSGELVAHALDDGRIVLLECSSCRGCFVRPHAWSTLIDAVGREEDVKLGDVVPAPPGAGASREDMFRFIRCPVCSEEMDRVHFAARAEAVIDVCRAHGTWFDGAELVMVVAIFRRLEAGEAVGGETPEEPPPEGPALPQWKKEMLDRSLYEMEGSLQRLQDPRRQRLAHRTDHGNQAELDSTLRGILRDNVARMRGDAPPRR